MAKVDPFLLDESQHHRPEIIQWWVNETGGKPMEPNMIHRYLSESPFFDWTSKNGFLIQQSRTSWETYNLTMSRQAFEDNIRKRTGLEYMIVGEPEPVSDKELADQGVTTGVYVIRKQDRALIKQDQIVAAQQTKRPSTIFEPHENGRDMWQITILGTYYTTNEAMYQAPNVFDMVGNRLTSAALSLNKLFDVADALPRYAPAVGHHYLPPRTSTRPAAASGSIAGTPTRSREGSIVPEESSLRSGSVNGEAPTAASAEVNSKDAQLLWDSLRLVSQYGDEFADENPLIGEPGSFRYTTSMAAVKKRRADEEAAAAQARTEKLIEEPVKEVANVFSDPAPKKAGKTGKDEKKGGKADKKRKKSRANIGGIATSPTTPGSATSTQPPDAGL